MIFFLSVLSSDFSHSPHPYSPDKPSFAQLETAVALLLNPPQAAPDQATYVHPQCSISSACDDEYQSSAHLGQFIKMLIQFKLIWVHKS
jgi:hypothetical protein